MTKLRNPASRRQFTSAAEPELHLNPAPPLYKFHKIIVDMTTNSLVTNITHTCWPFGRNLRPGSDAAPLVCRT